MSNPNQGHKPQVPAQRSAVPTPVAPASVAQTKAPEEVPTDLPEVSHAQAVKVEEVVPPPSAPLSKADVAELLGASEGDLDEFERFRQLSREAKEAEFEAARAAKRDALLRGSTSVAAAPVAPAKAAKVAAEGEITVFPLKTENRLRIGQRYYQFQARKPISVPADIIPHLVEKGIISPPAHLT